MGTPTVAEKTPEGIARGTGVFFLFNYSNDSKEFSQFIIQSDI
jgi:hypothetical protein